MPDKKHTLIFISLAFLFAFQLSGQQVTISGVIPGGESMELRLLAYADYISFRQQVLMRTVVDDEGKFELNADITETTKLFLETGHFTFPFFAEKGGTYVLHCDSIFTKDEYRPLYNKEYLPAYLSSEPPPGLNQLIGQFNQSYNAFIREEFGGIYQRRNTAVVSVFREQAESEYAHFAHPFLDQYIAYKLAGVELAMAPSKKPRLFSEFLRNKPVLASHPEYMDFFNSFFDKQVYPDNRFIPRADLYSTINYRPDLPALLDSLGKDSTLRNEVIRELVCLKSLGELYTINEFSKTNILGLLQTFRQHSKFAGHREIAANLISELTHLEKGFPPPAFELPDLDGHPVRLSDLGGRPVYISFFTTWSSGCLTELELMKGLFSEYRNRIQFVSISLDKDPAVVRELCAEKGYEWDFLFNGTASDLVLNYKIKTFPVFILLDSNGDVYEYPAYKPSEVIRERFDRLLGEDKTDGQ